MTATPRAEVATPLPRPTSNKPPENRRASNPSNRR